MLAIMARTEEGDDSFMRQLVKGTVIPHTTSYNRLRRLV
jgi:hypothetical protein